MASDVFNQTYFGIYEFFANLIPGTLMILPILIAVDFSSFLSGNTLVTETLLVIAVAFMAFVVGLAIQSVSALMEKYINKKKYGGYPSSLYLTDKDETFPMYFKSAIREILNNKFGTPMNSSPKHMFDLCYTFVMQNKVSERVPQFLRTYTFSRNMMVTMIIESVFTFYLAYSRQNIWLAITGFVLVGMSYAFYSRFLRYGESFAKEVLRSFFVCEAQF